MFARRTHERLRIFFVAVRRPTGGLTAILTFAGRRDDAARVNTIIIVRIHLNARRFAMRARISGFFGKNFAFHLISLLSKPGLIHRFHSFSSFHLIFHFSHIKSVISSGSPRSRTTNTSSRSNSSLCPVLRAGGPWTT